MGEEAEQIITKMYRDTFVRGLQGDLSRLMRMKEPTDLPSALHLCLKLENQHFSSNHATTKTEYTLPKSVHKTYTSSQKYAVYK